MPLPIWIVDAFVGKLGNRVLRGNPAAIVILDEFRDDAWGDDAWPDDEWLQNVAAEFNLSETAFLRHRETNHWDLRWFTPATEVDLCGHATLASAHVLWQSGRAQGDILHFYTRSGILDARRNGEMVALDFAASPVKMTSAPPALIEAVGLRAHADPVAAYRACDDWLLKVASGRLETLTPDFALLRQISVATQARGVIVTARAPRGAPYDFASRFFAPAIGINEDPATGSAHTKLAPFWSGLLQKDEFSAVQLSARGGALQLKLRDNRVEIAGRAETRVRGEWL